MRLFARRMVELTVHDAAARTHALYVARWNAFDVTHAIFMREVARKHVAQNFHIAMAMGAKACVLTHFSQRYQKLPVLEHAAEDEPSIAAEPLAMPHAVTLSYHQAGCWLDAQETVEQVAADAATVAWVTEFANVHYQPEVKQRRRPESFRKLDDRYNKRSDK